MVYIPLLIIVFLANQAAIATAMAGERSTLREQAALSGRQKDAEGAARDARMTAATSLDRVASAVDGAESSHGKDARMWRPDPSGPQGPMQVSEAAATDVGGGDRLDLRQNRVIGRAYLAQLYGRYGNWPDAIAAYNWGLGKMDAWVKAGRPPDGFLVGIATYLRRVLHDSGLCDGAEPKPLQQSSGTADSSDLRQAALDLSTHSICAHPYGSRSSKDLYKASAVALELAPGRPWSRFEREAVSARTSWVTAMRGFFGCTALSGEALRCR